MKYVSYNKEILTAQAEMIRLFSNISIMNPTTKKYELVPCVFGQSSRIFKSIMNPSAAPQEYPILSVERGHIAIDLTRNKEIHHDTRIIPTPSAYNPNVRPPTPINIDFVLRGFAKYPEQLDMIISNFIPFFNKDVYVKTPHPKIRGKFLSHQVVWNGNAKFEWKSTLQNIEQDIQYVETAFTYKTELYGGVDYVNVENVSGRILTINMSLAPSDGSIYPKFDASNPEGNFLGGFFAVPFSSDFDEYADSMIDNYIIHGENCMDNYLVTNVFNCRFNSGIKNCDIDAMDEAVKNGANIYKHSYWPYSYAKFKSETDSKYKVIIDWLIEHDALIPEDGREHIAVDDTEIHVAENA